MTPADIQRLLVAARFDAPPFEPLFETDRGLAYGLTVPGQTAVECWMEARNATDRTAYWPLIIGDAARLPSVREKFTDDSQTTDEIVTCAANLDFRDWLRQRRAEVEEDRAASEDPEWELLPRGDWVGEPQTDFYLLRRSGRVPLARVGLLFVPTAHPDEVPALMRFGGWNECPEPEVQVAAFRSWRERYGAEPVGFAEDIVEMRVMRPPTARDELLQLAEEQYLYCADIVDQGVGTIDALAATLDKSSIWFFWWD